MNMHRFIFSILLFFFNMYIFAAGIDGPDIHQVTFYGLKDSDGKFVKLKRVGDYVPYPLTFIFCVSNNSYFAIPQLLNFLYTPGQNVSWEISQCINEDCMPNKLLVIDKFVITANDYYSSNPQYRFVQIEPNYGATCSTHKGEKSFGEIIVKGS